MERILAAAMLLALSAAAHGAELPAACAPKEDAIVCMLKVERNNALDELAISQGQRHTKSVQEEALVRWWGEYVKGMDAQALWWQQYLEGLERQAQQSAAKAADNAARAAEAAKGRAR